MAEYKCETCHITMDADEEDKDCPVCSNEMHPVFRKKECSMRPSEQLRGIGAG
jgi:rubrerythrin